MKVTGFVLVGLAAILVVLSFSNLSSYAPRLGLAYNLSNASVLRRTTTERLPCPAPARGSSLFSPDESVPSSCPRYPGALGGTTYGRTTVIFAGVPLGVALAISLTIALVGAGLLIFGKRPE